MLCKGMMTVRNIIFDIQNEDGTLNRYFSNCIGAGRAGEVMRHVAYTQLETLQEVCPFRYIRFHGLFHEEMHVVFRDTQGNLQFNFQYVDMLFDSLLEAHIRPLVELGLMPKVLAKDDATVFWWKMNKSMPQDINEWTALIDALIRHLLHRYGQEEVRQWYFEVWNEPDHPSFFTEHDNIDAYFSLYDTAALTIKAIDAELRVGGPATSGLRRIPETIQHCREHNIPLDFISSHFYCVRGEFDADGKAKTRLLPISYFTDAIQQAGALCHKEGLPLLITEWSTSYSSRDPVHDSYVNAPFVLEMIKRCEGYADMFSYWTYTDIFEEVAPPTTPFHGGFGLFNVQSLPKPTLHAFSFLHRLGDTVLSCNDPSCYVTKTDTQIQCLFWNAVLLPQDSNNSIFFTQPLPAKETDNAVLEITGLSPDTAFTVTAETVGYRKGDVYNAYLDGHFTELPTAAQTAALKLASAPQKIAYGAKTDKQGVLRLSVPQTENQVDFITIDI